MLSTGGTVKAALQGDLAGYSASPNFEYSILMIPDWTRTLACRAQARAVRGSHVA